MLYKIKCLKNCAVDTKNKIINNSVIKALYHNCLTWIKSPKYLSTSSEAPTLLVLSRLLALGGGAVSSLDGATVAPSPDDSLMLLLLPALNRLYPAFLTSAKASASELRRRPLRDPFSLWVEEGGLECVVWCG